MQISQLPAIGAPLDGGFYAGLIRTNDQIFALIVAPKADGEHEPAEWGAYGKKIEGASSVSDGRANTIAMAEAGYSLAQWALTLKINGFDDWYLPARDELEIVYRNLKPTAEENYTWRNGENISAVPPTYAYTEQLPAQTNVEAFQQGSTEAFDDAWYWTSSQSSANSAWCQDFVDGSQGGGLKNLELRARAVRRLLVIQ